MESNRQYQDDELFKQFLNGIPQECVREVDNQNICIFSDQPQIQHDPTQQKTDQMNKIDFDVENMEIQQISNLSSISNIEDDENLKQFIKSQSGDFCQQILFSNKKQSEPENIQIQKVQNLCLNSEQDCLQSKDQSEEKSQQDIPYNAGYGSFLKEMEYWAKDVSFEDQQHDIWNQQQALQNSLRNQSSNLQEPSEPNPKLQDKYVIDFNEGSTFNTFHEKSVNFPKNICNQTLDLECQNLSKCNLLNLIEMVNNTCSKWINLTSSQSDPKTTLSNEIYTYQSNQQIYMKKLSELLQLGKKIQKQSHFGINQ